MRARAGIVHLLVHIPEDPQKPGQRQAQAGNTKLHPVLMWVAGTQVVTGCLPDASEEAGPEVEQLGLRAAIS